MVFEILMLAFARGCVSVCQIDARPIFILSLRISRITICAVVFLSERRMIDQHPEFIYIIMGKYGKPYVMRL